MISYTKTIKIFYFYSSQGNNIAFMQRLSLYRPPPVLNAHS